MKKTIPIVILLVALSITAFARFFRVWTAAEMQKASDLIVVGTVSQVRDLNETNTVLWPGWRFPGVETSFTVSKVLKGDFTNHTVVLHHYRFDHVIPPNCPCFVILSPTNTNQFLLYLVRDGTARFAPVSGQLDPAADAVRIYTGK
jgi:hypothetical protein